MHHNKMRIKRTKSDVISAPLGIRVVENNVIKPSTMDIRGPIGFLLNNELPFALANIKCKRSKQRIQARDITFFASKDSLIVAAALLKNADTDRRQKAINIVTEAYKIDLCNTTELLYDKDLMDAGSTSVNRSIKIGSTAFDQDTAWLTNIILHETIHANQFKYYQDLGLLTGKTLNNRQVKALDEFEAYYIGWYYKKELGLKEKQIRFLKHRMRLNEIDISDNKIVRLAKKGQMNKARILLLSKLAKQTS